MRKFLILILMIFITVSSNIASQETLKTTEQSISWKGVKDASSYLIEIRDSSFTIITSVTTKETSITLTLEPGEYEIRITVLNKFEKPADTSSWKKLTVQKISKPIIKSITTTEIWAGNSIQLIEVEGQMISSVTKAIVSQNGLEIVGTYYKTIKENTVQFAFDLSEIKSGNANLILKNTDDFISNEYTLKLKERKAPVISSLSNTIFYNDRLYKDIQIVTSNVLSDSIVQLTSIEDKKIIPLTYRYINSNEIFFSLNATQFSQGYYIIKITNPGGLFIESEKIEIRNPIISTITSITTKEENNETKSITITGDNFTQESQIIFKQETLEFTLQAQSITLNSIEILIENQVISSGEYEISVETESNNVTTYSKKVQIKKSGSLFTDSVKQQEIIEKEVIVEREIVVEKEVVIEKKLYIDENGKIINGGFNIFLTYSPQINLSKLDELFEYSFTSGEAGIQLDMGTGILRNIPVVNLLGLECKLNYNFMNGKNFPIHHIFNQFTLMNSIFIKSQFNFPINFVYKIGFGPIFTLDVQTSILNPDARILTSLDFALETGLSLRYNFNQMLWIDAGAIFQNEYYATYNFIALKPFISFGLLFQ